MLGSRIGMQKYPIHVECQVKSQTSVCYTIMPGMSLKVDRRAKYRDISMNARTDGEINKAVSIMNSNVADILSRDLVCRKHLYQ